MCPLARYSGPLRSDAQYRPRRSEILQGRLSRPGARREARLTRERKIWRSRNSRKFERAGVDADSLGRPNRDARSAARARRAAMIGESGPGYTRDQGEGIRHLYAQMEWLFLPERGARYARREKILRVLRARGLPVSHPAGASSYLECSEKRGERARPVHRFTPDRMPGSLRSNGGSSEWNRGELGIRYGELTVTSVSLLVTELAKKPGSAKLRPGGRAACEPMVDPRELAAVLGRDAALLVEDHLGPMVKKGQLERRHANPNHPNPGLWCRVAIFSR